MPWPTLHEMNQSLKWVRGQVSAFFKVPQVMLMLWEEMRTTAVEDDRG